MLKKAENGKGWVVSSASGSIELRDDEFRSLLEEMKREEVIMGWHESLDFALNECENPFASASMTQLAAVLGDDDVAKAAADMYLGYRARSASYISCEDDEYYACAAALGMSVKDMNGLLQDYLRKEWAKVGGSIVFSQSFMAERRRALWYGGTIATITYNGTVIDIVANGDVRCTLNRNGDVAAEVKDTGNNGTFLGVMSQFIENDEKLDYVIFSGELAIEDNNWFEAFISPEGSSVCERSVVIDDDDVFVACLPSVVLDYMEE